MKNITLDQLKEIYKSLSKKGYRVRFDLMPETIPTKETHSVPIVSNGMNGLKWSFEPKKNFTVWFTNLFANHCPERMEIESIVFNITNND